MIEKIIAALGLLFILAAAGALGYEAVRSGRTPPMIDVHVRDMQDIGNGYLVRFVAFNRGETTAAQVSVSGELEEGGRVVEQSTATLTYVPGLAEQQGGLFFTRDPRRYPLALRATGYEKP